MDEVIANPRARKAAVGGLAAVALIVVIAVFDLGPCADELTAEEFLAQGDEICATTHDEFRELQEVNPRTPTEAQDVTETLIELAEEERDAIGDLNEPDSLSDLVGRYLDARERGIDLMRDGLAAAEDADPTAYERAQAGVAARQLDRHAIAERIGFQECSKPLVSRDELKRQAEPPPATDPDDPPEVNNPPT